MKKMISLLIVSISICIGCSSLAFSASFEGTKRAAEQGDADAQYSLGLFYILQQDYKQGKEWYEKAANQGHADAQAGLSGLYYLGLGVRQDYQKARQ